MDMSIYTLMSSTQIHVYYLIINYLYYLVINNQYNIHNHELIN